MCWVFVGVVVFIQWKSMVTNTVWIQTFLKISFMTCIRKKKVIKVWTISRWVKNLHFVGVFLKKKRRPFWHVEGSFQEQFRWKPHFSTTFIWHNTDTSIFFFERCQKCDHKQELHPTVTMYCKLMEDILACSKRAVSFLQLNCTTTKNHNLYSLSGVFSITSFYKTLNKTNYTSSKQHGLTCKFNIVQKSQGGISALK